MNYPFWDIDIGYGIIMAVIAVIHVFVSHFAIGGGLYLVIAETFARKKNDRLKLQFLEKLSKFFVLVSVVFGALTGVGIWFIIGLLNKKPKNESSIIVRSTTLPLISVIFSDFIGLSATGYNAIIAIAISTTISGIFHLKFLGI